METIAQTYNPVLWPLALYALLAVAVVAAMLAVSYVLGQRHSERATGEPYESGIASTGSAHLRFANKFYIVAMLFVVFDVESVFIFAWAVSARELGWAGYVGVVVFIAVLAAALVYLWREGALDWIRPHREERPGPRSDEGFE
jgi:NADH-quinone oxidoreductase subunit A